MKKNILVKDTVLQAVKIKAIHNGMTIQQMTEQLLIKALYE